MRQPPPSQYGKGPVAIDLFCGAGGFSVGLVKAGWRVLAGVDSWAPAIETYKLNFDHPALQLDLSRSGAADIWDALGSQSSIDLVAGGPPCQGFSVQRIGPDEDDRNDLVLSFGRVVLEIRPRMFLMENVPGLLGARGLSTARRLEAMLVAGGYAVDHAVANAADYGVPQTRRRVFFFGWQIDVGRPFTFPRATVGPMAYRTVRESIGDLAPPPDDFTPKQGDPLHRRTRLSQINQERLRLIPPGGGFEHLPIEMRVQAHRGGADRIGHRYVYGRLDPDRPAATITARFDSFTRGRFAHPFQDRNITLREGARFQTFDDSFRFVGTQEETAALIGNAIPPVQAETIALSIRRHLSTTRDVGPFPDREWSRQLEFTATT